MIFKLIKNNLINVEGWLPDFFLLYFILFIFLPSVEIWTIVSALTLDSYSASNLVTISLASYHSFIY